MSEGRLTVFFNVPGSQVHGGPPTHLPLLEAELRKYVDVERFDFGRRSDAESTFDKLVLRTKDLLKLRAKISRVRPTIIHQNTAFDTRAIIRDAALVWLAKRHGIPVLLKMHGSCDDLLGNISTPMRQLRDFIFKNTNCIGVLSPAERDMYLQAWPALRHRVRVVKNIIKPEFHSLKRTEAEVPTLLFISRFIREKGMFELLESVPRVVRKFPTAQFIFVGSGSDAAAFDQTVREKSLGLFVRRVDHVGHLDTLKFYASAWALVFPTHRPQEGMPMVVAEAMAAGLPIVTSRTKFSRSYMEAGKQCLFIDPKNPASIAEAIVYLLESRDLRCQMGNSNRELAKSFRAEIVAQEFTNIYQDVVSNCSEYYLPRPV